MTRKLNVKKDAKIVRVIAGEKPEILKLRMMINVFGHNESNGMSRIYTIWSDNHRTQNNNK